MQQIVDFHPEMVIFTVFFYIVATDPHRHIETFAKASFWSLREVKRRSNLMDYQHVVRLLRFARNDVMGIMQRSHIVTTT